MSINNFTVIESVYGRFVVNRHCAYQADALIKTGRPHIEFELQNILALIRTLPQDCLIVDAGADIGLSIRHVRASCLRAQSAYVVTISVIGF